MNAKEKCDSFENTSNTSNTSNSSLSDNENISQELEFDINSCTEKQCHDVTHPCSLLRNAKKKCDSFENTSNSNRASTNDRENNNFYKEKILSIKEDIDTYKIIIEEINTEIINLLDFNNYIDELSSKKEIMDNNFIINQLTKINILNIYS